MLEKKSSEKSAKKLFYIHTNIVTKKWWEKTRQRIFPDHTNSASKKCWKNNRRKKVRKNLFLFSHEYRDQKLGEQNARNNFSEIHE